MRLGSPESRNVRYTTLAAVRGRIGSGCRLNRPCAPTCHASQSWQPSTSGQGEKDAISGRTTIGKPFFERASRAGVVSSIGTRPKLTRTLCTKGKEPWAVWHGSFPFFWMLYASTISPLHHSLRVGRSTAPRRSTCSVPPTGRTSVDGRSPGARSPLNTPARPSGN